MPNVDYILCGYEHGGTTLLSEIMRANGFESGFECGVLLVDSPAEFPTVPGLWGLLPAGWNISEDIRAEAITGDLAHFYDTITRNAFPDWDGPFFDKTPRYMRALGQCLNRAPFLKGGIVIHRDPRAVFLSQAKRLVKEGTPTQRVEKAFDFLARNYIEYFLGSVAHMFGSKTLFIPFEELVTRFSHWSGNMARFLGLEAVRPASNSPRFDNVASGGLDASKVCEYEQVLPEKLQRRILDATRLAAPFFANPSERAEYGELWNSRLEIAQYRLEEFDLPATGIDVDGTYFEPLTYLIRYPDVLNAGVNPIDDFRKRGRAKGKNPA